MPLPTKYAIFEYDNFVVYKTFATKKDATDELYEIALNNKLRQLTQRNGTINEITIQIAIRKFLAGKVNEINIEAKDQRKTFADLWVFFDLMDCFIDTLPDEKLLFLYNRYFGEEW